MQCNHSRRLPTKGKRLFQVCSLVLSLHVALYRIIGISMISIIIIIVIINYYYYYYYCHYYYYDCHCDYYYSQRVRAHWSEHAPASGTMESKSLFDLPSYLRPRHG